MKYTHDKLCIKLVFLYTKYRDVRSSKHKIYGNIGLCFFTVVYHNIGLRLFIYSSISATVTILYSYTMIHLL